MNENKPKEFNRIEYLKKAISAFLQSESKGINEAKGKLYALNRTPHSNNYEIDNKKRKVLELLLDNKKFAALIQREKQKHGILDQDTLPREKRDENLRKISELSQQLASKLAEIVFGDGKRTYNMSSLSVPGMIAKDKPITHSKENGPVIPLTDLLGTPLSLRCIGRLHYYVGPVEDNYIYEYEVTRQIAEDVFEIDKVFADIDDAKLEKSHPEYLEYSDVVANTLLTRNNIEFSQTNGYIGEISKQRTLEVNTEYRESGSYTFQASPNYALIFDCERIEAIQTYREQEKNKEQSGNDR